MFGRPRSVGLTQFGDPRHEEIGDLLVRAPRIAFLIKSGKIDRFAKPDTYLFTACPVPSNLSRKIIDQTGNKDWHNLRPRIVDDLADSRLRRQEAVRVLIQVSFSLGMKADHMPAAGAADTHKFAYRKLIEGPFLSFFLLAKKWRIHCPPTHDKIYKPSDGTIVKELAANWKVESDRTLCAAKQHARDRVHV